MKKAHLMLFVIVLYFTNCKENNISVIDEKPYLKSLGDNVFLHQSDMAVEYRITSGELEFWNSEKGDITKLTSTSVKNLITTLISFSWFLIIQRYQVLLKMLVFLIQLQMTLKEQAVDFMIILKVLVQEIDLKELLHFQLLIS